MATTDRAAPSKPSTVIRVTSGNDTGNTAAPAMWMGFAAVGGLIATLVIYRRHARQPSELGLGAHA